MYVNVYQPIHIKRFDECCESLSFVVGFNHLLGLEFGGVHWKVSLHQQITVACVKCEGCSGVNLLKMWSWVWVCVKPHVPLICCVLIGIFLGCAICCVRKFPKVYVVMKLCHEWNFNSAKYSVRFINRWHVNEQSIVLKFATGYSMAH